MNKTAPKHEPDEHEPEPPFGHPGRNFDGTPDYFEDRPLNNWAEPNWEPDEDESPEPEPDENPGRESADRTG